MDYNSIDEILSSGIANMTVVRNNSKNDDKTDTVTGVSWFTFNGVTASNIYVNGNSWFGFGSLSEHLRVNRRDGAVYSIYREEGTLYEYYKFLKIRWKGYSDYSQTSSSYAVEYDVILWDTGDISLHMVSIPTTYNNGTYSLTAGSTYSYTVSTSSPDVTFTKTDTGFTVSNNIINLEPPINSFFLIRNGNNLYTMENDELSVLPTTELSSTTFLTYGKRIHLLSKSVIKKCSSGSELLIWSGDVDEYSPTGVILHAIPPLPQVVETSINIEQNTVISQMSADCSEDVRFTVSTDTSDRYYYDNITGSWAISTSPLKGMRLSTLNKLTSDKWLQLFGSTDSNQTLHIYASIRRKDGYCTNIQYYTIDTV